MPRRAPGRTPRPRMAGTEPLLRTPQVFTGCPESQTATIVLRGGSEQFIEESHRSIHDALMIAKRGAGDARIVGGGGAVEMELSRALREAGLKVSGKHQLVMLAISKALEVVPRQLAMNSGFDPTDVLNALRKKHLEDGDVGMWRGAAWRPTARNPDEASGPASEDVVATLPRRAPRGGLEQSRRPRGNASELAHP